jgi:hypothetical protein
VVIWLSADSQGPDLLAFNAHGKFLDVLKIAWVVSLFGFILLVKTMACTGPGAMVGIRVNVATVE